VRKFIRWLVKRFDKKRGGGEGGGTLEEEEGLAGCRGQLAGDCIGAIEEEGAHFFLSFCSYRLLGSIGACGRKV